MTRRHRAGALALLLCLALVAGACSSPGSLEGVRREVERASGGSAEVLPPPAANPALTARVGLVLTTNSRTWAKLVEAPASPGVVVLFVQPGGPSSSADIQRGDVITRVDGEPTTNAERAVVLLRSRPGQKRTMALVKVGGGAKTVEVTARDPGNVNLRELYRPLIEQTPNDPVLYFLRAQAGGPFQQAMADVERAIELVPVFVEAISLRAELLWSRARALASEDPAQAQELRERALNDWDTAVRLDPRNTRVLVSRGQALATVGKASSAKRDAERARDADPTFPGAYHALALASFALARYADAARFARQAIALNPYDVRYYETLAASFMKLNRPADARKTVDAIIDLVEDQDTRERLLRVVEQGR